MLLKAKVRYCFSSAQKLQFPSHVPTGKAKIISMGYEAQSNVGPGHLSDFIILSYLSTEATLASMLFLKYAKHVPTSGPLLLQCPLPGMFLPPLIHISTYMTSPHQENLLHRFGSTKQQASSQLIVNGVCPALFLSVGLISHLFPPPRGMQSLFTGTQAVAYTAFQLCAQ